MSLVQIFYKNFGAVREVFIFSKESARDAWPFSLQFRSFSCRLTPPPHPPCQKCNPRSATEIPPRFFKVGNKSTATQMAMCWWPEAPYSFRFRYQMHQRVNEARALSSEKMSKKESSWFCQQCLFRASKRLFIKYRNGVRISAFDHLVFHANVTTDLLACRISRVGRGQERAPFRSNFFHFHTVFSKKWPNSFSRPPLEAKILK